MPPAEVPPGIVYNWIKGKTFIVYTIMRGPDRIGNVYSSFCKILASGYGPGQYGLGPLIILKNILS